MDAAHAIVENVAVTDYLTGRDTLVLTVSSALTVPVAVCKSSFL